MTPPAPEVTHDALFAGALSLRQPARGSGYRVNVDALLLAHFAAHKRAKHAVDLGSGVGGVALSLLHLGAATRVTLVEIEPRLVRLAEENLRDNGWEARGAVVLGNVADAPIPQGELVVCNPPYVPPGRGQPPSPKVRTARYGPLEIFVEAARRAAGRRARVCFVYPSAELTTLLALLRSRGLEAKRLRAVHGRATEPARVMLVEAVSGKPGGLVIEPPLVEMSGAARSPELAALLSCQRARV